MKDIFIDFNVKFGFEKIWKWKFWVLGVSLLSGIISYLYALQLPDEYRSTTSFIPPAINSITGLVFSQGNISRSLYTAGEEDIDRTVDYLSSKMITDSLAKKFDLYGHYGINPNDPNRDKTFYHVFSTKNRVSFSGRSVVTVECHDVDPKMAYNVCQAYLEYASDWFEDLAHRKDGLAANETQLLQYRSEKKSIQDTLAMLRTKYKLYHTDFSGNAVSEVLAVQIRNEPQYSAQYDRLVSLELRQKMVDNIIGDLEREYSARVMNLEQFPTLMWITSAPSEATFKARPKRSIIVLLTMLSTLVFSGFVTIMLDRSRQRLPI